MNTASITLAARLAAILRTLGSFLLPLPLLLCAAPLAWATTEMRIQVRNNTGGPADDFHFEVDNSGGSPVGAKRLTNRAVNSAAGRPTTGWQNTPGAGNNTNTTADFDKGTGAAVANGADGDFWLQNNTNYMKIVSAYWTLAGLPIRDANGNIIKSPLVDHTTDYSFNYSPSGTLQFDPDNTTDPVHYAHLLVKTGVSVAALQLLANPALSPNVSFASFDALAGTTLFRDVAGGSFTGLQTYSGPAWAAGTGAFFYIDDGTGRYGFSWGDGLAVPEPGSAVLLLGGLLALSRMRQVRQQRPG